MYQLNPKIVAMPPRWDQVWSVLETTSQALDQTVYRLPFFASYKGTLELAVHAAVDQIIPRIQDPELKALIQDLRDIGLVAGKLAGIGLVGGLVILPMQFAAVQGLVGHALRAEILVRLGTILTNEIENVTEINDTPLPKAIRGILTSFGQTGFLLSHLTQVYGGGYASKIAGLIACGQVAASQIESTSRYAAQWRRAIYMSSTVLGEVVNRLKF